ncbi:MAG: hypothetical protein EOM31_08690 [Bacteroidia bacterium]|nr:hypothetical protein [Bacteroidia bacterium]
MEDKKISGQESLELIAQMIRETQDRTARYAAYPLLIWGYTTAIISVLIWLLYRQTHLWQLNFLWFALPLIGMPLTLFFSRKDQNRGVINYIDRVTKHVWMVFGIVAFLLSCCSFKLAIDILFMIPLLMGMATTISGLVSKYKPLAFCGAAGIVLSFFMLFMHTTDKLLVFAAIFVIMQVVPGHLLNQKMKQCSKS